MQAHERMKAGNASLSQAVEQITQACLGVQSVLLLHLYTHKFKPQWRWGNAVITGSMFLLAQKDKGNSSTRNEQTHNCCTKSHSIS